MTSILTGGPNRVGSAKQGRSGGGIAGVRLAVAQHVVSFGAFDADPTATALWDGLIDLALAP